MAKRPNKNIEIYVFFLATIAGLVLIGGVLANSAAASNSAVESNNALFVGQGVNLFSHGGTTNGCFVDRYNDVNNKNETSLNCTANDVQLAQYSLLTGPTSCVEGEEITLTLLGQFIATASERYDVGMFIATDGGDPNTKGGTCYNDYLHPVSLTNTDINISTGNGPFFNGELTQDTNDFCGDIEQKPSGITTNFKTAEITIICQDSNNNGTADVNSCTVWSNSRSDGSTNKPSCEDEFDTIAGTTAKCRCGPVEIAGLSVPLTGTIEVIKELVPSDALGVFNLQVDGQTEFPNAGNGDSTGPVTVSAGLSTDSDPIGDTHTVGETAGNGTTLSLFDTEIFCEDDDDETAYAAGVGPLDVFVEPDDAWVCRIVNTFNVTPAATEPPATEPPATEPPATEPPATEPPATEPPATEPPATEPPATEPPATEPPATETPTRTRPPATNPPATSTPTKRPPTATATIPSTLAQPTSPAETPQIIIPETGLDLSLSGQGSGLNVLMILLLGLGFVGIGLMFHGISTQLLRNRRKK